MNVHGFDQRSHSLDFAKSKQKGVYFCPFANGSRDRAACVAQLRTKKPGHDKTKSPIRFGVNISLTAKKQQTKEIFVETNIEAQFQKRGMKY